MTNLSGGLFCLRLIFRIVSPGCNRFACGALDYIESAPSFPIFQVEQIVGTGNLHELMAIYNEL